MTSRSGRRRIYLDMERDRVRARQLAKESLSQGDPTGWFDRLYREEEQGLSVVPWADRGPSPNLLRFEGAGKTALVVGCGFGDDAQEIASWGFKTTGFDISPTAIRACEKRFSGVSFVAADLLSPPAEWTGRFDFVLESNTLQALPVKIRPAATRSVAGFVKEGGMLLLIARGREESEPEGNMPWPLTRREVDLLKEFGLQEKSFEDYFDDEEPPARRFRAVFVR